MTDPRNTRRWKNLRLEIIRRDSRCGLCREPFNDKQIIEVDHIKEVSTHPELAFDPTNLRAVHRSCHMERNRKQNDSRRRAAKDPTTRAW